MGFNRTLLEKLPGPYVPSHLPRKFTHMSYFQAASRILNECMLRIYSSILVELP